MSNFVFMIITQVREREREREREVYIIHCLLVISISFIECLLTLVVILR